MITSLLSIVYPVCTQVCFWIFLGPWLKSRVTTSASHPYYRTLPLVHVKQTPSHKILIYTYKVATKKILFPGKLLNSIFIIFKLLVQKVCIVGLRTAYYTKYVKNFPSALYWLASNDSSTYLPSCSLIRVKVWLRWVGREPNQTFLKRKKKKVTVQSVHSTTTKKGGREGRNTHKKPCS